MAKFILRSQYFTALLILIAVARWANVSAAEDPQDVSKTGAHLAHLSLEQLGEIEVTTESKEPVKVSRVPSAIFVITQEEIRRSGATSIPEALRLVPGVEVARIDSNQWSLGVRGFGSSLSRSVLVLIDGRSVYTPLYAGVYWNVQDTLIEDIDRIEVIRGPGGTIWGANAVDGVINIITKSSKDTHGSLVTLGGGNVDQGTFGFRYGGGNGKGLNYRIYGKGFTRGPEFHPDGRNFDDWRMDQSGFRADWSNGRRDTVTLQGDIYNGDAGGKAGFTTYSPPFSVLVEQNAELSGGNLLGQWRRVLSGGSDIELQAYYDRTNRLQANFGEDRDTVDIDFIHHLTLTHRQDFLWGLGARWSSGNAIPVVPTIVFTPSHLTDKLYSAFLQDEIPIVGDQLSLTVGSKLMHNIYTGFEVQPSVRLLWTPQPNQTAWLAVTRAVSTPSRVDEDLQLTAFAAPSPLTFFRLSGDGKFFSEQLVGYEAGYRSLIRPKLYIDVTAFYNSYDHMESIEPGTPFFETSPSPSHLVLPLLLRNGILGSTNGIEIAPDWRPRHWWRLEASYSFLHMDLRKRTNSGSLGSTASTEGSSPHHQVVIQSSINLPGGFECDQTYRYISALPSQLVSSYSTADLRLGWRFAGSFDVSLEGQNLLQPHHAEFGGDPGGLVGIKRSAYAKITWQK